jgi:tetratricopeptide (TPR) repeat protein
MKKFCTLLLFVLAGVYAYAQGVLTLPPNSDNQKSSVSQWIGPVQITITYNSPNVHAPNGDDRTDHIWGELVQYGLNVQTYGAGNPAPWRAGANENTTITFSHPVKIEGKDIAAGTYGLFFDVEKDAPWKLILSKDNGAWGSYFYNSDQDVLRVNVTAVDAPYTEFLTFGFDDRLPNTTTAFLQWEKKKAPFKIEVPNVNELYIAAVRDQLKSWPGFDTRNFQAAAAFCAKNKLNLNEALTWADTGMSPALGGTEDFQGLAIKSQVLIAMGKDADANVVMDKAIKLPSARVIEIHGYARTLLAAGQKEKAMEVFQFNAKAHPEDKFTPNVGLARGYTAMGNTKEAIKYWELAIKNLPANQAPNKAQYEGELKKLKDTPKS